MPIERQGFRKLLITFWTVNIKKAGQTEPEKPIPIDNQSIAEKSLTIA